MPLATSSQTYLGPSLSDVLRYVLGVEHGVRESRFLGSVQRFSVTAFGGEETNEEGHFITSEFQNSQSGVSHAGQTKNDDTRRENVTHVDQFASWCLFFRCFVVATSVLVRTDLSASSLSSFLSLLHSGAAKFLFER